jgi:hypothetical protein
LPGTIDLGPEFLPFERPGEMNESSLRGKCCGESLPETGVQRRSGWAGMARPVALLFLMLACRGEPESGATAQTASPGRMGSEAGAVSVESQSPKRERSVPALEAREAMVGWWLRHDQSYMIVIDSVDDDGRVEARYLNPRPINVSKAETWVEEGSLRLLVELTDENYPGNFYELVYRAGDDVWVGVYHHLGNDETYEVYFLRFEGDTGNGKS